MSLSNLPPGCTDQMIDDQCAESECPVCGAGFNRPRHSRSAHYMDEDGHCGTCESVPVPFCSQECRTACDRLDYLKGALDFFKKNHAPNGVLFVEGIEWAIVELEELLWKG